MTRTGPSGAGRMASIEPARPSWARSRDEPLDLPVRAVGVGRRGEDVSGAMASEDRFEGVESAVGGGVVGHHASGGQSARFSARVLSRMPVAACSKTPEARKAGDVDAQLGAGPGPVVAPVGLAAGPAPQFIYEWDPSHPCPRRHISCIIGGRVARPLFTARQPTNELVLCTMHRLDIVN